MTRTRPPNRDHPTRLRVTAAGITGLVVAVVVGAAVGWRYAGAAGWTLAAAVYTGWTWRVIAGMGPRETAAHATRENPARPLTDLITLTACVASLAAVVYLLAAGSSGGGPTEAWAAALGIASVAGAWLVVHTTYTTRYALLYYSNDPGGIDFNQHEPPAYCPVDQSARPGRAHPCAYHPAGRHLLDEILARIRACPASSCPTGPNTFRPRRQSGRYTQNAQQSADQQNRVSDGRITTRSARLIEIVRVVPSPAPSSLAPDEVDQQHRRRDTQLDWRSK